MDYSLNSAKLGSGVEGPELIFAIIRPVGTMSDSFRSELEGKLASYGYRVTYIKLSDCILEYQGGSLDARLSELDRTNELMDMGNAICRNSNDQAAVALLGVKKIIDDRGGSSDSRQQRSAYIIDSLKRVEEVEILREIYGDRVIVIGLQATLSDRRETLDAILTPQLTLSPEDIPSSVENLIGRDYYESDPFGQSVMSAFPMADYFVDISRVADVALTSSSDIIGAQVGRLVDLLFGSPDYRDPTNEEFGMHLAWASSTRSTELGLRVGACIEGEDGKILGLGYNSHPTKKGSPIIDPSPSHIRELLLDTLKLLAGRGLLSVEAKTAVETDPDYMKELLNDPLKDAKIKSLIEFQYAIHAEMSALHRALRGGHNLAGATLYVTTYPCHNCAKHLMALGLSVKYLEPYPKSKAAAMYGPDVESHVSPFTGVAPRRYQALFSVREDRKTPEGLRLSWTPQDRKAAQPKVSTIISAQGIQQNENKAVRTITEPQNAGGSRG